MFESIILGLIQGIVEWLPISSEGSIVAIKNTFFSSGGLLLSDTIKLALFLHFGTFLAALIYFRKDVWTLTKTLFKPKSNSPENKKVLNFLIISTIISGLLGFLLLKTLIEFESQIKIGSHFINLLIAGLLFITAYLQLKSKKEGYRQELEITTKDGIILGLTQGFAVLPGLSRSGLTVSTLLLRKFDESLSLRLSFLMSLPIVLLGNIVLVLPELSFSTNSFYALLAAFFAGLLTIDLLLKLAKKINFGYFALFFGILVALSTFI